VLVDVGGCYPQPLGEFASTDHAAALLGAFVEKLDDAMSDGLDEFGM
jgi:hypothetical protein